MPRGHRRHAGPRRGGPHQRRRRVREQGRPRPPARRLPGAPPRVRHEPLRGHAVRVPGAHAPPRPPRLRGRREDRLRQVGPHLKRHRLCYRRRHRPHPRRGRAERPRPRRAPRRRAPLPAHGLALRRDRRGAACRPRGAAPARHDARRGPPAPARLREHRQPLRRLPPVRPAGAGEHGGGPGRRRRRGAPSARGPWRSRHPARHRRLPPTATAA